MLRSVTVPLRVAEIFFSRKQWKNSVASSIFSFPLSSLTFIEASVRFAGEGWVERFETACE